MATAVTERPIPTGEGLTFEKVWAMFQETDRKFQETDRKFQETREQMQETREQMQETDRKMKETDRKIGELSNRFGELAEHLVAPGIAEKFNELGHHFDGVAPGGYIISDDTGKEIAEVDILLENGECLMAVEVKTRPRIQDVKHHIKRMKILREHRNKRNDNRTVYGAIAGAVFGLPAKQAAIEAGFYTIEQSGDTMRIDVPDGFIPKKW